jgi:predicted nucleotide-binding protein
MDKPRIFLGSSGKQAKLLQALTRGLEEIAHVDPWTTSFNPGTTTLERLVELAHEVDFAAFVFAQDDWTNVNSASSNPESGQASRWTGRQAACRIACGATKKLEVALSVLNSSG